MSEQQTLARQGGRSRSFLACSEHESRLSRTVVRCAHNCSLLSWRSSVGDGCSHGLLCARGGASARPPPPGSVVFYRRCRIVACMGQQANRAPDFMQHKFSYFKVRVVHLPSTEIYYSCVHTLPSISNLFSPELTQCDFIPSQGAEERLFKAVRYH